jgi:hypothetical protein
MGILLSLIPTVLQLFNKLVPDAGKQKEAAAELMRMLVEGDFKQVEARANVVMAEVSSRNWLASLWRPIMMLTFLVLVIAAWFGFVPSNMPEAMIDRIFNLLEIGMGGYVVGRSAEKITSTVANVFNKPK